MSLRANLTSTVPPADVHDLTVSSLASAGAELEAARLQDQARHEAMAARFQRPVDLLGTFYRGAATLTRGSLSLAGRMLCALVVVLLVLPFVLNILNPQMDLTYGMEHNCTCDFLYACQLHAAPRAYWVWFDYPAKLVLLLLVLAAGFAVAAVFGILARETLGWCLRSLSRWAQRLGVEVSVPPALHGDG